jgi:hypothetical protein
VRKDVDTNGICKLAKLADIAAGNPRNFIRDVEALLIRAMGTKNIAVTNFSAADEWFQVKEHEEQLYRERVAR